MTDARSLIMGTGAAGFSFNRPGDSVLGQIITEPKAVQVKKFGTNELDFWPSGDPKMQTVFQVQTQWRNYEGIANPDRTQPDSGIRTIYLKGKHFERATKDAILAAGASWLDVGGWFQATYTGDDYNSKAGIKPKMFEVRYQPPQQQPQQAHQGYGPPQGQQGYGQQAPQPPRPPQQAQPNWQQAGWRPEQNQQPPQGFAPASFSQTVPSHHGTAESMPDWAKPTSAPPVSSAPPAPNLSTLQMIANSQAGSESGSPDYGSVEPAF